MDDWQRLKERRFVGRGKAGDLGIPVPKKESGEPFSVRDDPQLYVAEPELADAVNVAVMLRMPLLLTGDPGTGKTQLADRIAFEYELGAVLKFETKSTSDSRDPFYEFDMVGRLGAAQLGEKGNTDARLFITYNALGRAVMLANDRMEVEKFLPLRKENEEKAAFTHDGPRASVVLIDEIDKASRDFPNDLLNEIEGNYFRLREMGNKKIEVRDRDRAPIVVITSNSERQLPDPFLRRCVYYHIKFPEPGALAEIVNQRMGAVFKDKGQALLKETVDFFVSLRRRLQRQPTTAELLRWIEALEKAGINCGKPLREQREICASKLSMLYKNREDQVAIRSALDAWVGASEAAVKAA